MTVAGVSAGLVGTVLAARRLRHCPVRKAKPEELSLPRSCYSTLLPVYLQLEFQPGSLHINTNGRNGKPAFNTALFSEETLGQLATRSGGCSTGRASRTST